MWQGDVQGEQLCLRSPGQLAVCKEFLTAAAACFNELKRKNFTVGVELCAVVRISSDADTLITSKSPEQMGNLHSSLMNHCWSVILITNRVLENWQLRNSKQLLDNTCVLFNVIPRLIYRNIAWMPSKTSVSLAVWRSDPKYSTSSPRSLKVFEFFCDRSVKSKMERRVYCSIC